MLNLLRRIIPRPIFNLYHRFLSWSGALRYGHPSRTLLVIGVTGTTGKSTVIEMLAAFFRAAGFTVGVASTIRFQIGERTWMNNEKMTMLGRWRLQKLLRQMVHAGCTVAIIETTSQGLAQNRHLGVDYDAAVLTNLSPEHIESHGSFDHYRAAKGKLFSALHASFRKEYPKISVVNLEARDASFFLGFAADRVIGYSLSPVSAAVTETFTPETVTTTEQGSDMTLQGVAFHLPLQGRHNAANALAAIATASAYGVPLTTSAKALQKIRAVPGRFATVVQEPFRVIVDYAHEPAGLEAVYRAARSFHPQRMIAVLGSTGGGRDTWKRPVLGKLAAQYAQFVIVTNEDPYDEDPMEIIHQVADGAMQEGKKDGQTLFRILDRGEGIKKALDLARPGDLVMITGKGSEQVMAVKGGKKIPWSDRDVVRELIRMRST